MTQVWILVLILWADSPPTQIISVQEFEYSGACASMRDSIDLGDIGRATCITKARRKKLK